MVNQKGGTSLLHQQLNYAFPRNIAMLTQGPQATIAFLRNIAMLTQQPGATRVFPCNIAMQNKRLGRLIRSGEYDANNNKAGDG